MLVRVDTLLSPFADINPERPTGAGIPGRRASALVGGRSEISACNGCRSRRGALQWSPTGASHERPAAGCLNDSHIDSKTHEKGSITCRGNQLKVELNGEPIIDLELDKSAIEDRPPEGYIGFQDEAKRVWYRNVRIKELK